MAEHVLTEKTTRVKTVFPTYCTRILFVQPQPIMYLIVLATRRMLNSSTFQPENQEYGVIEQTFYKLFLIRFGMKLNISPKTSQS